jgi:hypothetical protein
MTVDYASAVVEYGGTPSTITLLELTKLLDGEVSSTNDDLYTLYLQICGEAAEQYCDNKLVSQSVLQQQLQVVDHTPLRFYPVNSLTTVTVDGEDVTESYKLYTVDGITYLTRDSFDIAAGSIPEQVDITYDAGYAPLPADAGYAIARSAIDYKKDSPTNPADIKKETVVGVGSIEYDTQSYLRGDFGLLTAETLSVLDRYRRLSA